MKNRFFVCSFLLLALTFSACDPKLGDETRRNCGSAEYFAQQIDIDSIQRQNTFIESAVLDYQKRKGQDEKNLRGERVLIPVVVHILHEGETSASNITDAQVQSQIAVLNASFGNTNTDLSMVPAAFSTSIGNPRIEFVLARRDPDCNATNGITRQEVDKAFYTSSLNDAKSAATGGVDPWDTDKYLNVWVVEDLRKSNGDGILGYSSFPADAAAEQGFVVEHIFFGNTGTGTSRSSFALGRTAVHEFGHYFNLIHIWGDDCASPRCNAVCDSTSECSGTDLIDDTPNAGEANFGTPTFPLADCCSSGPNGVMFMNYMDYVDDDAMIMFSQGQVDRMVATLYTTKNELIASDAIFPPPASAAADLCMKDTPSDLGNEPNNESDRFYISQDIWLRNSDDGATNHEHNNPVYNATDPKRYVYVRVRNKGCATSESATLKLYWAKASSGLSWEDPWTGGVTVDGAVMGGEIGSQTIDPVDGGGFRIMKFEWDIPNPADYTSFGAGNTHFCLLARIEESGGMTEGSNLTDNVKNNNNIVWKNIAISEPAPSGGREASLIAANYDDKDMSVRIAFEDVRNEASVFDGYEVFATLAPGMYEKWVEGGEEGEGIENIGNNMIQVIRAGAYIEGMDFKVHEVQVIRISTKTKGARRNEVYFLDVIQFNNGNEVGGQVMIF